MYTDADIEAASTFAEANTTIRYINAVYNKLPNIGSKLLYTIRDATDKDYYIPTTLLGKAKVVDVKLSREACEALSCNPNKATSMCSPGDTAEYYTLDGDQYDINCQPACFNVAAVPTVTDGTRQSDTPMLHWNEKTSKCLMVATPYVAYLEKPYFRDTEHYKFRNNDMPTGFTRVVEDKVYGTGFTYKGNPNYCNYFYKHYDGSNDNCKMSAWEKILDAVVGESLISIVRDGINKATTGSVLPSPTIAPFPSLPENMTLSGWKADINKNFVPPEEIDYDNDSDTMIKMFNIHRSKRSLVEEPTHPAKLYKYEKELKQQKMNDQRRAIEMSEPISEFTATWVKVPENNILRKQKDDDDDKKEKSKWDELLEKLKNLPLAILESLCTDSDFLVSIGISVAVDSALAKFKVQMAKLITKMGEKAIAKAMETLSGKIGSKVISSAIKSIVKSAIGKIAIKVISKVAIFLAKIAIAIASVVEWVLIFTMVLDLLFSFWSPTGMSNMFPPGYSQMLYEQGEKAYRQALGVAVPEYTFGYIVNSVLTTDECMAIILEGLVDRLRYLDALVVNSEGSRIDKGDHVEPVKNPDDFQDTIVKNEASQYHFNQDSFNQYNERFHNRVKTNKYIRLAVLVLTIGAVAFATIQQYMLALIAMVLMIICAYICSSLITDTYFMNSLYPYDVAFT